MEKGTYIKMFADMAVVLDIVPSKAWKVIGSAFSDDIKKDADLTQRETQYGSLAAGP